VEMHTAYLYLNPVLVVCATEIFFTLTNQYFIILYIMSRNNDMTNKILLFLVKPFITDVLHMELHQRKSFLKGYCLPQS
jgi:hypothetical protein